MKCPTNKIMFPEGYLQGYSYVSSNVSYIFLEKFSWRSHNVI